MLERITTRLVHSLLAIAAAIIFLLSFLVVADVVGRGLFNSPVKGTPEIVSMSIVIICFLLAAYAVQSGGMLRTDVIVGMFGRRGHAFADLASGLLGAAFFILIVWGSFEPALHSWISNEFEGEGALRVPVWPARFIVMFGAALVVAIYLGQTLLALLAMLHPEDASPPTTSPP
ncbi:TRAP transporter small permease subunit [Pseudorhodoplanes sinuspersici]|nr:TRAP transporter small permease [Pseudorhodoplanes sinuspersici]RKE66111.1 TRAP-type mannitol/chloroaromatic compound transport system permease small subunit [Pseudorhodoplanes sinuspersici]